VAAEAAFPSISGEGEGGDDSAGVREEESEREREAETETTEIEAERIQNANVRLTTNSHVVHPTPSPPPPPSSPPASEASDDFDEGYWDDADEDESQVLQVALRGGSRSDGSDGSHASPGSNAMDDGLRRIVEREVGLATWEESRDTCVPLPVEAIWEGIGKLPRLKHLVINAWQEAPLNDPRLHNLALLDLPSLPSVIPQTLSGLTCLGLMLSNTLTTFKPLSVLTCLENLSLAIAPEDDDFDFGFNPYDNPFFDRRDGAYDGFHDEYDNGDANEDEDGYDIVRSDDDDDDNDDGDDDDDDDDGDDDDDDDDDRNYNAVNADMDDSDDDDDHYVDDDDDDDYDDDNVTFSRDVQQQGNMRSIEIPDVGKKNGNKEGDGSHRLSVLLQPPPPKSAPVVVVVTGKSSINAERFQAPVVVPAVVSRGEKEEEEEEDGDEVKEEEEEEEEDDEEEKDEEEEEEGEKLTGSTPSAANQIHNAMADRLKFLQEQRERLLQNTAAAAAATFTSTTHGRSPRDLNPNISTSLNDSEDLLAHVAAVRSGSVFLNSDFDSENSYMAGLESTVRQQVQVDDARSSLGATDVFEADEEEEDQGKEGDKEIESMARATSVALPTTGATLSGASSTVSRPRYIEDTTTISIDSLRSSGLHALTLGDGVDPESQIASYTPLGPIFLSPRSFGSNNDGASSGDEGRVGYFRAGSGVSAFANGLANERDGESDRFSRGEGMESNHTGTSNYFDGNQNKNSGRQSTVRVGGAGRGIEPYYNHRLSSLSSLKSFPSASSGIDPPSAPRRSGREEYGGKKEASQTKIQQGGFESSLDDISIEEIPTLEVVGSEDSRGSVF